MQKLPPLTDPIAFALAQIVDDSQQERRDPSHSDIDFCVEKCELTEADPKSKGQTVGKAKRVRAILTWALSNSEDRGRAFTAKLIANIQSNGGFRNESPNYVGDENIKNLQARFAAEGFELNDDGDLRPQALDALSNVELTDALISYARRAQRGAEDAALVLGSGKDLLEAVAAHVLREMRGIENPPHNFPMIMGQAFNELGLKTSADKPAQGEPPQHRLQRALYDAACAVSTLRNKQGTGHGHPWISAISPEEARHATQVMGVVADLLLRTMEERK